MTELIATIVIMGLVIAPLCTALMQSLNLVSTTGDRTQLATDADRAIKLFSDDVADAQTIYNAAAGATTIFQMNSGTTWTQSSSGPSPVACANSGADWIFVGGTFLAMQYADQGLGGDPTLLTVDYYATITGSGPIRRVQIGRAIGSSRDIIMTGYCQTGDIANPPVIVSATAPGAANPFNEQVQAQITLRDSIGNLRPAITLVGVVRATQTSIP